VYDITTLISYNKAVSPLAFPVSILHPKWARNVSMRCLDSVQEGENTRPCWSVPRLSLVIE
jgi:hypothetical protein